MTKWYVTVDRFCSHCDDPDAHVWTVSRDPNDTGWDTDSGYPGYGLTKRDAEELANAANRVEQLENALRTVKEWHGYGLPPETIVLIDAALEGK